MFNAKLFRCICRVGSKNFKKWALEDHTKSKPHMKTYQLCLRSQGMPLEKRAKSFSSNSGNESIVSGFSAKDLKHLPVMRRQFEVTFQLIYGNF